MFLARVIKYACKKIVVKTTHNKSNTGLPGYAAGISLRKALTK